MRNDLGAHRRLFVAGLLAFLLSGCQLYWVKSGADMPAFTADHQACVRTAGTPVDDAKTKMLVNLDVYRACLKARGWNRETGGKTMVPPGYFRGLENQGPVAVDEVPKQLPSM